MRVLTEDSRGVVHNPSTEDDWQDWVPVTATRNYVLKNPLLDWLNIYGEANGYIKDVIHPDVDFVRFIRNRGIEFENAVVAHLIDAVSGEAVTIIDERGFHTARDLDKAIETYEAMQKGTPLIVQGVLRNPENRTYGMPDLLVRSDVLARLFKGCMEPLEDLSPAPAFGMNCHYIAVDIKYTTLRLLAKNNLSNSGSFPAYKVQLHLYNMALARLQKYLPPKAYILGTSWKQTVGKQTKGSDDCMDRLGFVPCDEVVSKKSLSELANESCDWIRKLRSQGSSWNPTPVPTVAELRPNKKQDKGRWGQAVDEILHVTKDLTSLWYVSASSRGRSNS